jgi:hypothetical protein
VTNLRLVRDSIDDLPDVALRKRETEEASMWEVLENGLYIGYVWYVEEDSAWAVEFMNGHGRHVSLDFDDGDPKTRDEAVRALVHFRKAKGA